MMAVAEGIAHGKIKYLDKVNGRFQLQENTSDGYYAQGHGLMGITYIKVCHLVVRTMREKVTVAVHYNVKFFVNRLVQSCKEFFSEHIIPKLLLKKLVSESDSFNPVPEKTDIAFPTGSDSETSDKAIYIATPMAARPIPEADSQPQKRKRLTMPEKTAVKYVSKSSTLSQLVLPKATSVIRQFTSAKLIVAESFTCKCASCRKVLPEYNIAPDNSDPSVGCDCPNCGGCDTWMCWPCAKYDQEWSDARYNWYCPMCTRECDIVN